MSRQMLPKARPKQSRAETEALIRGIESPVIILGVRGYYKKMGEDPRRNEINIYDDALFVWSQNGYMSFNANTDPSVSRPRVAKLKPGVWQYRLGIHNLSKPKHRQYPALVQAAPVTVVRQEHDEDTGWFGINIHRGSRTTTSSLGCVTLPVLQWNQFFETVKGEMARAKISRAPFVLVENTYN
jgi:lysozyme